VSREYRITQADIDRKYVENTAVVHGKNPRGFSVKDISGTAVDNNQPTKIILYQKPDLRLKKTVLNKGTGEDGQFTIGDDIIYLFEIKHAGEIAVENMQIIDRMIQAEAIPVAASRLLNQSISLQGTYKVTEADILAGRVFYSATLEGFDEKFGNSIQDISVLTFE